MEPQPKETGTGSQEGRAREPQDRAGSRGQTCRKVRGGAREKGKVETPHGQLLHRAADLRDRAGLAHALDRRHLHLYLADRAVSPDHAAPGPGHHDLHRRRRIDGGRDGHHPARAADQRREGDDLLQLRQHQQWGVDDRRDFRRRLFPGYRRGRHPEPRADGPGRVAPGSQAVRRVDQEDLDRHGLRGQPDFEGRPVRRDLPGQLLANLRP